MSPDERCCLRPLNQAYARGRNSKPATSRYIILGLSSLLSLHHKYDIFSAHLRQTTFHEIDDYRRRRQGKGTQDQYSRLEYDNMNAYVGQRLPLKYLLRSSETDRDGRWCIRKAVDFTNPVQGGPQGLPFHSTQLTTPNFLSAFGGKKHDDKSRWVYRVDIGEFVSPNTV